MIFLPWLITVLAAFAAALAVMIVIEQGVQRLAKHREATTARTRMSLLELFVFLDPQLLYVVAALFSVAVVFGVLFASRSLVIAVACGLSAALFPAISEARSVSDTRSPLVILGRGRGNHPLGGPGPWP